jgi:acyl carrier protein
MKYGNRISARLGRPMADVSLSIYSRVLRDPKSSEPPSTTTRPNRDGCDPIRVAAQFNKHEVRPMSDIAERVKKIVVEHLGVEPDKVIEGASFIDDLGADSLDTVELVMAFEEEFGCEIPDDAAETILTVGDAVKFLEKNAKS